MMYHQAKLRFRLLASAAVIAVGALLASASNVQAAGNSTDIPAWNPKSSEKLIKLPATYLKKSLDHDFQESTLGLAIQKTEEKT
ncbi:MAG: hypothetical protein HOG95_08405, partial [Rhodospirillaceae bacterium]|nr:hypothetical protein [Rhodospirillaceae bacterium]